MSQRIALIDDNANDAQVMRRILEREGFEVRHATSGEEGMALSREFHPDCVLVDYRMPGLDGYEVCRRMKSDAQLENIPLLMLTGADSSQNIVEGLESGADDFVTKSAEVDVILARVRALLRVKSYQDRIVEQSEQLRGLYEEGKQKSDKIMALNLKLNNDLRFARRVQEALLPPPEFLGPKVEIRSAYVPSEMLSGDFYDYFIADARLYLFIGDVSGHGLPAAILVSLLKSHLHSEVLEADSLADFMGGLNDFLHTASLPSQYATAQLFRFDPESMTLVVATAAHPAFVLIRKDEPKGVVYEQPGHMLGSIPNVPFDDVTIPIREGDLLFCYTDGLTDRRTASGEFYSLDRVTSILEKKKNESLAAIYEAVYEEVTHFESTDELKDDIAFILARFG